MNVFARSILVGIVATTFLDIVNAILSISQIVGKINIDLIGRIVLSWTDGQFIHQSVSMIPNYSYAYPVGLVVHYSTGIAFTITILIIRNKVFPWVRYYLALLVGGLLTSLVNFMLLFPSVGLGFFAVSTPSPGHIILSTAINHLIFASGMIIAVLLIVNATELEDGLLSNGT